MLPIGVSENGPPGKAEQSQRQNNTLAPNEGRREEGAPSSRARTAIDRSKNNATGKPQTSAFVHQ